MNKTDLRLIGYFLRRLKNHRLQLALLAVGSALFTAALLAVPVLLAELVRQMAVGAELSKGAVLLSAALTALLVLDYVNDDISCRLTAAIIRDWSDDLFSRIMFASGLKARDNGGAMLYALLEDVRAVASALAGLLPKIGVWLMCMLCAALITPFYGIEFGIIAALMLVLCYLPTVYLFRKRYANSIKTSAVSARMLEYGLESMRRIEAIKAAGHEDETVSEYGIFAADFAAASSKTGKADSGGGLVSGLLAVLLAIFAVFYAASLCMADRTAVATVAMPTLLIILMSVAERNLSAHFSVLGDGFAAFANLMRISERYGTVRAAPGKPLILSGGNISLNGVSLKNEGKIIFGDLNLKLPTGRHTAVAGRPGSGKTAFVKMLGKMTEPAWGRIEIDGQNIYELSLASFRGKVAFVSDEADIFTGTLEDNIRFGSEADSAGALSAAELAGLGQFAASLPQGMLTAVTPAMSILTASIRARIMLARALCAKPKILIMDSILSVLPPFEEIHILNAVRRALPGITIISVSARRSSADAADYVCALHEGGRATLYPAGSSGATAFMDTVFGTGLGRTAR